MSEVLTNPKAGYYINRDVFGAQGDFITSPEVSQMFGEMVGVWVMCLWEQMGRPKRVNLVELGPGRGTLMADLLRGASKFKNFTESLHVHLVECSPALKTLQHKNLKCVDEENADGDTDKKTVSSLVGTPVSWHATLEQVPSGSPTIIIAHEFFDALPIHQFQKGSRGWCEKMVDVAEDSSLHFVLSPHPTPATLYLLKRAKWAGVEAIAKLNQIEICPKAMDLTQTIVERISSDGGGALIIDYGSDGVVSDSLQVSVTDDNCQAHIPTFSCRLGVYIEGSVSPPLSGVHIRIFAAGDSSITGLKSGELILETTTGTDGSFVAGPLYDDVGYNVQASKLHGLVEASKTYQTLQDVIDHDVANDTVKTSGSYSRNLRRVRQGLDLVRAIFEQLLSTSDIYLKEVASTAYGEVCAPYHSWAVRTAVYAGMYTLPTRDQLFVKLNETGCMFHGKPLYVDFAQKKEDRKRLLQHKHAQKLEGLTKHFVIKLICIFFNILY